jgi:hypothetical protein
MGSKKKRALTAILVAGLCGLAGLGPAAGMASAGEYHVYSCRTPSGEVAPTDGWTGSVHGAYDNYAIDTCGMGGALTAAIGGSTSHIAGVDQATWMFSVPAGEAMAGATLWRAGNADGGDTEHASYAFWLAGPADESLDIFEECLYQKGCLAGLGEPVQPLSGTNQRVVPTVNLGPTLYLNAGCVGAATEYKCESAKGDEHEYAAVVYLYAADLILEQAAGPTASNVGGELASAPAVSGISDLTFDAGDPGAGVWETTFSIDGKVVQSTVPDENGGRCRNVGQTTDGLPAFLYLQPCPPAESVDVSFNTTAVSNGPHHLVVSVVDPAGNSLAVLDREIDIDNPVPPSPLNPPQRNGANASTQATLTARWASTTKSRLTRPWGKRETITGSLTAPGGVPIAGASIDLTATPSYTGASTLTIASPRTGEDGRFTVSLPAGESSRTLRLTYSAYIGVAAVATRTLTLDVKAGVSLSIAPRVASVGRSIFFKGALSGTPLPVGGKQLVLEARSPGGEWIEFDVIHTAANGRYRASYRFKFPGPERYQFRVLCKQEADFPFLEASSNVIDVLER